MYTYTYTYIHTYMHLLRTHIHTCIHTHIHAHTYFLTGTRKQACIHTYERTSFHAHVHSYVRTLGKRTHTHTSSQAHACAKYRTLFRGATFGLRKQLPKFKVEGSGHLIFADRAFCRRRWPRRLMLSRLSYVSFERICQRKKSPAEPWIAVKVQLRKVRGRYKGHRCHGILWCRVFKV